jgi:hypothetical protein
MWRNNESRVSSHISLLHHDSLSNCANLTFFLDSTAKDGSIAKSFTFRIHLFTSVNDSRQENQNQKDAFASEWNAHSADIEDQNLHPLWAMTD